MLCGARGRLTDRVVVPQVRENLSPPIKANMTSKDDVVFVVEPPEVAFTSYGEPLSGTSQPPGLCLSQLSVLQPCPSVTARGPGLAV